MRKFFGLLFLALAVLVPRPAFAQISVLNTIVNTGALSGGSVAQTMTFSVSSGTNTILVCNIGAFDDNERTVNSFLWNGSPLTAVPSSRISTAFIGWTQWFYMINPGPATSQNISVTLSGDVTWRFAFGCLTYQGVDQSTIFDATAQTAHDIGTAATVNITTTTNGAQVLGSMTSMFDDTTTAGLTELYTVHSSTNMVVGAEHTNKASAGVQAVSWTLNTFTNWYVSAIALKPSSGGGGGGGGGGSTNKKIMMLGVGDEQ